MATVKYTGARYLLKFVDEWTENTVYEELTALRYNDASYISKWPVPATIGAPDENPEYWAYWGSGNVAFEELRNLVLQFINKIDNLETIYPDIEIKYDTYKGTTYALANVGKLPIKAAYHPNKTVTEHANEIHSALSCNGGLAGSGAVISNGEIAVNNPSQYAFSEYIAFDNNGNIASFPYDTEPQTIINAGYTNAALAYYKLVNNGVPIDVSEIGLPDTNLEFNPRTAIFVDNTGNKYIIVTNGRLSGDIGLTPSDLANLLVELGAINAWNLDGGGSSNLTYQGTRINRAWENYGLEDRNINVSFYIDKIEENKTIETVSDLVNNSVNNAIKALIANDMRKAINVENMNPDKMVYEGEYYSTNAINVPSENKVGYLKTYAIPSAHGSSRMIQEWYTSTGTEQYIRYYSSNTWTQWKANYNIFNYYNTDIAANSDLNNFLTPGKFNVDSVATANTILNIPSKEGGNLIVLGASSDNFIYQIYIGVTSNSMFIRRITKSSGVANPWFIISADETKTESYTTSTSGNIQLSYSPNDYDIVNTYSNGYILLPFINNNRYFVKVINYANFTPVNEEIEIDVTSILKRKAK